MFDLTGKLPIVGETADPWIFLVLMTLVAVAALGVAFPDDVFPGDDDARAHVIQVAAGLLVILGAYFTAVNIREARAHQAFDRLCRVIEQLGNGNEAVRVGAVKLLESIALEKLDLPSGSAGEAMRARRNAIREALRAVAEESAERPSSELARQALQKLEAR